eukprot:s523_g20.t1
MASSYVGFRGSMEHGALEVALLFRIQAAPWVKGQGGEDDGGGNRMLTPLMLLTMDPDDGKLGEMMQKKREMRRHEGGGTDDQQHQHHHPFPIPITITITSKKSLAPRAEECTGSRPCTFLLHERGMPIQMISGQVDSSLSSMSCCSPVFSDRLSLVSALLVPLARAPVVSARRC